VGDSLKEEISWEGFRSDVGLLLSRLKEQDPFDRLVAVSRGGLVPAAIVARELGIRIVDTICVASYAGTAQGNATLLKSPESLSGRVLIVDDLADTGATIELIRGLFPAVTVATVYAKPMGEAMVDVFGVPKDQATWLVFPWE